MADRPCETRTVAATLEIREDGGAPTLEGYAATFNQPYDLGPFREQIHPAAFNRTLGTNPDVRLLIDHEGQPLARTKSGTLTLSADPQGLRIRAELDPSDPDVQRLLPKMRRGDLDQMSFAFRVPKGGDEWSDDYSMRTLRNVELNGGDVSVVTYPANPNTMVTIRAEDVQAAKWTRAKAAFDDAYETRADLDALLGILASINAADSYIDSAIEDLAEQLDVPNPDTDAPAEDEASEPMMQMNSQPATGLSLRLAKALAELEDL